MTTTKISSDVLEITVATFGAELHSIKKDGIEYLWQGNPEFWARKAPILFPIVGKLKNGSYRYNDENFKMAGHGFARDNMFKLIDSDEDDLVFELKDSKETKLSYPFDFRLRVSYKLRGNKLLVKWEVKNQDEQEMYFGIGAHPAFNVPLESGTFEAYKLTITPTQSRQFIPLDPETGTLDLDKKTLLEQNEFSLTHDLFKDDALIFETPKATEVVLSNSIDNRSVKIAWKNMPFLGLWSPYPAQAPFVCIEPWCGIADDENTDGDLTTKFGINSLDPGKKFKAEYTIEIN
ncbi:aldose 1-epimerase [Lactococcus hodotermopsidis]|uniref:Aldose 1-epimerase n=1 Tax=Pseudolactococcus hodotermopsidis TaxID=2709157 RepID=A0A6A0BEV1_9LACT|nr:aldose 1-epimerase family protein [Lactococcus hodotermopsidis]GFH42367.1 aldose 1-epimerase [Lactococcus hodotermopsidis]